MAAHELRCSVAKAIRPRFHWQPFDVAPQVVGKLGSSAIAPLGLPGERLEHDQVEVSLEGPPRNPGSTLSDGTARSGWRLLLDATHQCRQRRSRAFVRQAPSQELVQHHPERVDIGRGCDRLVQDLLGCSIGGGEGAILELRRRTGVGAEVGGKNLGDAEVEQFHLPPVADKNVRGFEIPMDHKAAMGRSDRLGDANHQLDPNAYRTRAFRRPARDRESFDLFQHEVRPAAGGQTTVEQTGDMRVFQSGEDLALAQKATFDLGRVHAEPDELERHRLLELSVGPVGLPHLTHATTPE
ncbi:MAG: hypothetical protein R2862_09820 [Thermoanaerobaculia bacterium]